MSAIWICQSCRKTTNSATLRRLFSSARRLESRKGSPALKNTNSDAGASKTKKVRSLENDAASSPDQGPSRSKSRVLTYGRTTNASSRDEHRTPWDSSVARPALSSRPILPSVIRASQSMAPSTVEVPAVKNSSKSRKRRNRKSPEVVNPPARPLKEQIKKNISYATVTRHHFDGLARFEKKQYKNLLITMKTNEDAVDDLLRPPEFSISRLPEHLHYNAIERNDLKVTLKRATKQFKSTTETLRLHIDDILSTPPPSWDPSEAPNLGTSTIEECLRSEALTKAKVQSMLNKVRAFVEPSSRANAKFFEEMGRGRQTPKRREKMEAEWMEQMRLAKTAFQGWEIGQDGRTRTRREVVSGARGREAQEIEAIEKLFRYEGGEVVEDEVLDKRVQVVGGEVVDWSEGFGDSPTY
ncbi:hypothetical protein BDZ85DRAFT_257649 [Elsinoe ampelina]|uniref:Uncharacterized protein n=1 Tax=Elsinoe ampelina TaxID=302913 RepID=A0A6A6GIN5_9PEZI|nr:hypothetical protein BDZ85DRAFT_257649 [Elsinoe ampelina]